MAIVHIPQEPMRNISSPMESESTIFRKT